MNDKQVINQLQTQLMAITQAVNGHVCKPLAQGDYGWSPTYQKVLELRRALRQPVDSTSIRYMKPYTTTSELIDVKGYLIKRGSVVIPTHYDIVCHAISFTCEGKTYMLDTVTFIKYCKLAQEWYYNVATRQVVEVTSRDTHTLTYHCHTGRRVVCTIECFEKDFKPIVGKWRLVQGLCTGDIIDVFRVTDGVCEVRDNTCVEVAYLLKIAEPYVKPEIGVGKHYRHKVSGKQYLVECNGIIYYKDADGKWCRSSLSFNKVKEFLEPLSETRWFTAPSASRDYTLVWKLEGGILWFFSPNTGTFRPSTHGCLDKIISEIKDVRETDYESVKQYIEPKVRWFKGKGHVTNTIYVWKVDHTGSLWLFDNGKFVRSSYATIKQLQDCHDNVRETDYDSIKGIIKGCE